MTAVSLMPPVATPPAMPPAATGPPAKSAAGSPFAVAPGLDDAVRPRAADGGTDLPQDGNVLPPGLVWQPLPGVPAESFTLAIYPPAVATAVTTAAAATAGAAAAAGATVITVPGEIAAAPGDRAASLQLTPASGVPGGGPAPASPRELATVVAAETLAGQAAVPAPDARGATAAQPDAGTRIPAPTGAPPQLRADAAGAGASGAGGHEPLPQLVVERPSRPPTAAGEPVVVRTALPTATAQAATAAAGSGPAAGAGAAAMQVAAATPALEDPQAEAHGKQPAPIAATSAAGATPSLSPPQPAPQAATMQLPARVSSEHFGDALGERVLWMADRDLGAARLTLNPPQLGPLEVRVQVSGDQASVSFTAHNYLTRDALEQAMPRLRDMLGAHGFTHVNVNIAHHSFSERPAGSAPYEGFAPGLEEPPAAGATTASGAARQTAALLDAYA